jgi:hypothetical protein
MTSACSIRSIPPPWRRGDRVMLGPPSLPSTSIHAAPQAPHRVRDPPGQTTAVNACGDGHAQDDIRGRTGRSCSWGGNRRFAAHAVIMSRVQPRGARLDAVPAHLARGRQRRVSGLPSVRHALQLGEHAELGEVAVLDTVDLEDVERATYGSGKWFCPACAKKRP